MLNALLTGVRKKERKRITEKFFLRNIRIYYLEEHIDQLTVTEQTQGDIYN
jgi:hypothetical protein